MRTLAVLFLAGLINALAVCSESLAFVREASEGVFTIWPESEVTLSLQVGCPTTPLTFWGPCWTAAEP